MLLALAQKIPADPRPGVLDPWMAAWEDFGEFEVIPIMTSAEATAQVARRLQSSYPGGPVNTRIKAVGETVLRVKDLEAVKRFYTEVIGLGVLR